MSDDEQFVRSIYPKIKIVQYFAEPKGIYDFSHASKTDPLSMRGKLLSYVFKDNYEPAWKLIKERIEKEMLGILESDPADLRNKNKRRAAKKAPKK